MNHFCIAALIITEYIFYIVTFVLGTVGLGSFLCKNYLVHCILFQKRYIFVEGANSLEKMQNLR